MLREQDIRRAYLDFFSERGHTVVKSSSLIPENDPTLMFTNSGMVQFKDIFTGKNTAHYKRATTAQKCLRAGGKHNDLDNVGYTARHHTFFEMLGNFSFGDYFKEDAISWAWEFVTNILQIPKEKLLVTVHASDEEAAKLWKKIAMLPDNKIIRINTSDNFWTMGPTGPCGPCSEIFYDHGEHIQGGMPGTKDEDGDRYVEIWNLVFTQFNTLDDGRQEPLEHPCIDTGMGLERITAVLQGVNNNYDIDIFKTLIEDIKNTTNTDDDQYSAHYNVIADHIRAICFMIADGITPSNDGRGYVLRRIIRRAMRHGYTAGVHTPFLYKLVQSVVNVMGEDYTELQRFQPAITDVLKNEEECFIKTIDNGMHILNAQLEASTTGNEFPVDVVYKLYDTYGFPYDLTSDILRAAGKFFDQEKLNKFIEARKQQSKTSWTGTGDSEVNSVLYNIKDMLGSNTEFIRECENLTTSIEYIVNENKIVDTAVLNDEVLIFMKKTPFYAECGGQVGDIGMIVQDCGKAAVLDTKLLAGLHCHKCRVIDGKIVAKKSADAIVQNRMLASCNHTATHMLQKALQTVLGSHVVQKGSLVTRDHLRFDFLHNNNVTCEQLHNIEIIVNKAINDALPVTTEITDIESAVKSGAMALFGEKYGETVRVVSIGGEWSKELCGGTHVKNTIYIKNFKIISCTSIGSGIKRIEALTHDAVIRFLEEEKSKCEEKIKEQLEKIKSMSNNIIHQPIDIKQTEENINGIFVFHIQMKDAQHKSVLAAVDKYKTYKNNCIVIVENFLSSKNKTAIVVFTNDEKINLLTALEKCDIKFGGKPYLVQAASSGSKSIYISIKDTLSSKLV